MSVMNHCNKKLKANAAIRRIFKMSVFFWLIGIYTQPILAQFSNETDLEYLNEVTFELPSNGSLVTNLFTQRAFNVTYEERRKRKAVGCLLLVSGTFMKIQSRSIYNEYLQEFDLNASQSLYNQANGLHKASLVSMSLGGLIFVIPLGKK